MAHLWQLMCLPSKNRPPPSDSDLSCIGLEDIENDDMASYRFQDILVDPFILQRKQIFGEEGGLSCARTSYQENDSRFLGSRNGHFQDVYFVSQIYQASRSHTVGPITKVGLRVKRPPGPRLFGQEVLLRRLESKPQVLRKVPVRRRKVRCDPLP